LINVNIFTKHTIMLISAGKSLQKHGTKQIDSTIVKISGAIAQTV
jgi:hypothetical protein